MKPVFLITALSALLCISAHSLAFDSQVEEITFEFRGKITSIEGILAPQLRSVFDVGGEVSGNYSFDPTTTNTSISPVFVGSYYETVSEMDAYYGDNFHAYLNPAGEKGEILVWDYAYDKYKVTTHAVGTPVGSALVTWVELNLHNVGGYVFSSVDLPLTPPPIEAFRPNLSNSFISFSDDMGGNGQVFFTLDSLTAVPEPSTLTLASVGLLAAIGWRIMK